MDGEPAGTDQLVSEISACQMHWWKKATSVDSTTRCVTRMVAEGLKGSRSHRRLAGHPALAEADAHRLGAGD